MSDEHDSLVQAATQVLVSLRSADGLNQTALGDLYRALDSEAAWWQTSGVVSKAVVSILVELYPDIEAASYAYPEVEADAIREAARQLADRILELLV
jgi:hypothetical protein